MYAWRGHPSLKGWPRHSGVRVPSSGAWPARRRRETPLCERRLADCAGWETALHTGAGGRTGALRGRAEPLTVHPFIPAGKRAGHSVKRACELLKVSRTDLWARRTGKPGPRAVRDTELTEQITAIHEKSHGAYGSPHVHAVLKQEGAACGRRRVARLMRAPRPRPEVPRSTRTEKTPRPADS
ncbi:IS3 family transposase [Streptomyces sp. NPDC059153]|uniref:IS3 family transposase n=1 Tax=unclassified Streptomyces TaxID=2593676 RepID=UPI0036C61B90